MLSVLLTVNDYFKMGLHEEIEKRFEEFKSIWRKDGNRPPEGADITERKLKGG